MQVSFLCGETQGALPDFLLSVQIVQIPMIMLSRVPAIKQNKLMGNVVFWLGLYAGFPLLCVAYVAY
jgi:sterol O-acyltransferase